MPTKLTLSSDLSNLVSAADYNAAKTQLGLNSTASPTFSSLTLTSNGSGGAQTGLVSDSNGKVTNTVLPYLPLIENRHTLRDFYSQLYAYSLSSTSTRIGIAYYGDSVADDIAEQFYFNLSNVYQGASYSEPGAASSSITYVVTGTPLSYDGSQVLVGANNNDGTGGFADFTYLPSAAHKTCANGTVINYDIGQATGWNNARVYFATGPGFGSAAVDLIDRNTSAVISSINTGPLTGSVLGWTKAEFNNISQSTKYNVKVTSTGSSVILHTIVQKPHGLTLLSLNRGGCSLTQNNYSNSNILSGLVSDLGISLMFLECKEENPTVSIPLTMARLNALPNTSKFIIGSLPDSSSASTQIANNTLFRNNALAYGFAYFDAYAACKDYTEMLRLGWITTSGGVPDGTHPNGYGNSFVAGLITAQLAVNNFPGMKIRSDVVHTPASGSVSSPLIQTFSGDGSGNTISIIIPATGGGTNNNFGQIQNIRRLCFGPASGTVPLFEPSGANVNLTDSTSTARSLLCAGITASGTNSVFPRAFIGTTSGPSLNAFAGNANGGVSALLSSLSFNTSTAGLQLKTSASGNTGWVSITTDTQVIPKTIVAAGTTGAATINNATGRVNFASAATSLVVTNSMCDANSIITVSKATNDATARLGAVVAGAGFFTIYMDVAPVGECAVNFRLSN